MFVNALTACDKYSLRNRHNLTQPIQMQLSEKEETYLNFFVFLKATLNFKRFPKKRRHSLLMDIRNYVLRETCLNKCLKNAVSEDTSANGMVNGNKHC